MFNSLGRSVIISFLFMLLFSFCEAQMQKKQKKKNKQEQETYSYKNRKENNTTLDCDTSFWKYVYNRQRLQIISTCKTVTGVIMESDDNEDGDHHMLLKLDAGQDKLLTKKNLTKKEGNLVIEAVCAAKTTLSKVGNTCNGYINKIQIPKLGEHVKVTGSYVIDSHNGWAEIHPITKIEVLK